MIAYLKGTLLKREEDRILLLVNNIGYEILVPAVAMETFLAMEIENPVSLYIYYHQTDRQPKPILIGFNQEIEKEFFVNFISVEAIGPLKAVKMLNIPIGEIADAIESKDAGKLMQLKGIGKRTAQKIIASLSGKMGKFAQTPDVSFVDSDISKQVIEVLVNRLGYKLIDARRIVSQALKRNSSIKTPENLFDEALRSENPAKDAP